MNMVWIIIAVIIAAFITYLYVAYRRMKKMPAAADHEKIIHLNDSNFKARTGTGTVLVDFWAEWCMPCKMMTPILNAVAEETQGQVTIGKLNVDQARQTAARFNVRSIPTLLIFRNGKEVKRITGVKSKEFIMNQFDLVKRK